MARGLNIGLKKKTAHGRVFVSTGEHLREPSPESAVYLTSFTRAVSKVIDLSCLVPSCQLRLGPSQKPCSQSRPGPSLCGDAYPPLLPTGLNRPHAASVAGLGGSSFSQLLGHSAGFSGPSTGSTSAADAWAGFQSWVQAKKLSAGSGLRSNYRGPACAYSFSESYARHQVPGSYLGPSPR